MIDAYEALGGGPTGAVHRICQRDLDLGFDADQYAEVALHQGVGGVMDPINHELYVAVLNRLVTFQVWTPHPPT